jgi:hypothetical protein
MLQFEKVCKGFSYNNLLSKAKNQLCMLVDNSIKTIQNPNELWITMVYPQL